MGNATVANAKTANKATASGQPSYGVLSPFAKWWHSEIASDPDNALFTDKTTFKSAAQMPIRK